MGKGFGIIESDNAQQLLQLHGTMVATITASETRRQNVSTISIGLISAGFAFLGTESSVEPIFVIIPIALVSAIWWATVRYFGKLAKVKWDVVHEIEQELVASPFTDEWEKFEKSGDSKPFLGPAKLEQIIPISVFLSSVGYLLFRIHSFIC